MSPRRSPSPDRIRIRSRAAMPIEIPIELATRVLAVLDRLEIRPSIRAQRRVAAAASELISRGLEASDLTTDWPDDE